MLLSCNGGLERILLLILLIMNQDSSVVYSQVSHERNLIWAQKDEQYTGVSRIVGASGDPNIWVTNRTASTKYITAPNSKWHFMALGFDYGRQLLFWTDPGNKKIQGLRLNGSNVAYTIYTGTSNKVDAITVDWLAGNIYWCDALYNWIAMAPATDETTYFRLVITNGLYHPTGIAAYPHKGLLFWSDWGAVPKIEKSSLSGEERQTVVERDIIQPMGVTIDFKEERIYWVDRGKGTIESVDIFGQTRRNMFEVPGTHFFGIALYQNFVFTTEQEGRQLYVFNRGEHKHEVNFNLGSAVPYGIIMYNGDSQPLASVHGEEVKPAVSPSEVCASMGCSHMCISEYGSRASCACSQGHALQPDGRTCLETGYYPSPQFIYSIGNALCRFPGNLADMSLKNVSLDTQCFLTSRQDVSSLSFNFHQNAVYFSENKTKTISRMRLIDGETPEVLLGGTGSVEGLSVDWISENMYWTDSEYQHVMVAKLDGRFQSVFIKQRVDRPRGIVVDAVNRHVFWSDVGSRPRIERCSLDGENRQIIVSKNLRSPNHLVIDYITSRLYWTDSGTDSIEWMSLESQERQLVSHPGAHLYGITVFQDFLVWTDQHDRNGIHVGKKEEGEKIRGVVHPGIGEAGDVITYDSSMQPLTDGPCDFSEECSQLCLPSRDPFRATCKCAIGFVLSGDGKTCNADAFHDNFLIFTDTYQKQIYQMSLLTGEFHAVPLSGHDNPIALDFDPIERKLVWTDVAAKVIKRSNVNGSEEEIVRLLADDSVPDGIAIDPLSRLIYMTDAGQKKIVAMDIDGQMITTLVSTQIDLPRAIVLDPVKGQMYWTDWGSNSRIEKANMDGSSRQRLVDTGIGAWPNGLAIDTKEKRLFWCDARSDRIETTDLEGRDRKVLFHEPDAHFFGIVFLDGMLYYSDWTKKTIMRLEWTGDKVISSTIGPPVFARANDIHAYTRNQIALGSSLNSCSYRLGGCSHMCIPVPSGRRCACPDGMYLAYNGQTCSGSALYTSRGVSQLAKITPTPASKMSPPKPQPTEPLATPSPTTSTPSPSTTTATTTTTLKTTTQRTEVRTLPTTQPTHHNPPDIQPTTTAISMYDWFVPSPTPTNPSVPSSRTNLAPTQTTISGRGRTRTMIRNRYKPTTLTPLNPTTPPPDIDTENQESSSMEWEQSPIYEYPLYSDAPAVKVPTNLPVGSIEDDLTEEIAPGMSTVRSIDMDPGGKRKTDQVAMNTDDSVIQIEDTHEKDTVSYPPMKPPRRKGGAKKTKPEVRWKDSVTMAPPVDNPKTSQPGQLPDMDLHGSVVFDYSSTSVPTLQGGRYNSSAVKVFDLNNPSFYGFLGLLAGGIVLMSIIVVAAVLLYKKLDTSKSRSVNQRARPASAVTGTDLTDTSTLPPPPPPWTDNYELPTTTNLSTRARYGEMGDNYYTGEVDSGIENPGYQNRDSLTSYDGVHNTNELAPHHSFSTFRSNSMYSLDSINSFDSFDSHEQQ